MSKTIKQEVRSNGCDRLDEFMRQYDEIARKDISFEEKKRALDQVAKELNVGFEITVKRPRESTYDWEKAKRISIYIYPAQLKLIEEICRKRKKSKRQVFLEAIQAYIGAYRKGAV